MVRTGPLAADLSPTRSRKSVIQRGELGVGLPQQREQGRRTFAHLAQEVIATNSVESVAHIDLHDDAVVGQDASKKSSGVNGSLAASVCPEA